MQKIYQHNVVDASKYTKIACKSGEPMYSRTLPSGTHIILSDGAKNIYKSNGTGLSRVGVMDRGGSINYALKDCWIMKHGRGTKEGNIEEFLYKRFPESVIKKAKFINNLISKILPSNIAEAMKTSVAKGKWLKL